MGAIHQDIEQFKRTDKKYYGPNKVSKGYEMVDEFSGFRKSAQEEVFRSKDRGNEKGYVIEPEQLELSL